MSARVFYLIKALLRFLEIHFVNTILSLPKMENINEVSTTISDRSKQDFESMREVKDY